MSKIKVNDIKPTGAELFEDSENFLHELSNDELDPVMGGQLIITFPIPTYPWTITIPKTLPYSPVIL